jgi:hypothetical protein
MEALQKNEQGRARGLYDEQLQRQRQEKFLFRRFAPSSLPLLDLLEKAPEKRDRP